MKSLAIGLSVRFFSVTMPTGVERGGISTRNSMQVMNTPLATGRFFAFHPAAYLRVSARLSSKILPAQIPPRSPPLGIETLKNRTLSPIAKLFIDYARTVARPLAKG